MSSNLMTIPEQAGLNVTYDILRSLRSCIEVTMSTQPILLVGVIVSSYASLGSFLRRGSDVLRGTDLPLREMSREVVSLPSVLVFP